MESRAAGLSPAARSSDGSSPQSDRPPSASHVHTRTERVLVLLRAGAPVSEISTGSRWSSRSRRRNPARLVSTEAVLSGRDAWS